MTRPAAPDADRSGSDRGDAWDRAVRQAVDWTILIDDDPDGAELRARLDAWRRHDPLHERAWVEASHASDLIAQTKKVVLFPATSHQPKPAEAPLRRTARRVRPGHRLILSGAVAAAAAWVAVPQMLLHIRADHITATGEQQTVTLDDGSTVRLAPDSAVRVSYADDSRNVELLSGEAYFEVKRNPARPFNVQSNNATVTVLGTGFDVRQGDSGTDVAVKHGRVRVSPSDGTQGTVILGAGQRAHMPRSGLIVSGSGSAELVGAWNDRRITAVDRSLSEVLADLRRYHTGAIILTSSRLGRSSVTGTFETDDPSRAASLIVQPHGGTVRQITPWLIVVSGP
jgi:transmembrane sensor